MPKLPNAQIKERVLDAAQELWTGENTTLTMRALAQAAETTTPTIYRWFRGREDVVKALLQRVEEEFLAVLSEARSLEEISERYIDFAMEHSKEYTMLFAHRNELLQDLKDHGGRRYDGLGSVFSRVQTLIAERLGGILPRHRGLVLSIWALWHGTATLLITGAVPRRLAEAARMRCVRSVRVLIRAEGEALNLCVEESDTLIGDQAQLQSRASGACS